MENFFRQPATKLEEIQKPVMEASPAIPETSIEQTANYKGNWWLAQLSRFKNPTIRKQLVDFWEKNEQYIAKHGIRTYVDSFIKKDPTTNEIIWKDEELGLPEMERVYETVPYTALSRAEIEKQIEDTIQREENVTLINQDTDRSNSLNRPTEEAKDSPRDTLHEPRYRVAEIGMKDDSLLSHEDEKFVTTMSLVEAHEKGHSLRDLRPSPYLTELFSRAFDLDPNSEVYGYFHEGEPKELIERMAQLKNYFGMQGDEKFTLQHLDYARTHYIRDVGFNNQMTAFFAAITPETEFGFLKLMNSIGI
jgi:hypothetical protein